MNVCTHDVTSYTSTKDTMTLLLLSKYGMVYFNHLSKVVSTNIQYKLITILFILEIK